MSELTISEMDQGGRLVKTCPEDTTFAALLNLAKDEFWKTDPMAKLNGWLEISHVEQQSRVKTILEELEGSWRKATKNSHKLFDESNRPTIVFESELTNKSNLWVRETRNWIHTDWEDPTHNRCIQHYAKTASNFDRLEDTSIDKSHPLGEFLYLPKSAPKESVMCQNHFWRWIDTKAVLNNLVSLHMQSVHSRLLRVRLGSDDPLRTLQCRMSIGKGGAADMADMAYLLCYFTNPAVKEANNCHAYKVPVSPEVERLMKHPYYRWAKAFSDPNGRL